MIIFIIAAALIVLIFVSAVLIFVNQFRKKKLAFDQEKTAMLRQYELDLLNAKLESQQKTMQHIGREIHDNVGQKLTLASIYAKQYEGKNGEHQGYKLKEIGLIIDESLAELRQLSKSLTNPEALQASLAELLSEEAKRINAAGVCYVSLSGNAINTIFPPAEKNIFFRILQEFIQNSLKHADCRRVNLAIDQAGEEFQIRASDDGKGFDTTLISTGIGLQNMDRRAAQVNADLALTSIPGKGTSLLIKWIP